MEETNVGLTEGVETPVETTGTAEAVVPGNTAAETTTATTIEAPEGLSNKDLWDSEKGQLKTEMVLEELNRQTQRAEDLRKKLSKGVDLPKTVEEYNFTAREELKDVIDADSEMFGNLKEIALKNGFSNEQLNGFINDYMALCVENGLVQKPLSAEEQKAAKEAYVAEQKKILGNNANEQIQQAVGFIESQYKKGLFTEAEKKALLSLADKDAVGIMVVNKLREMSGQPTVPMVNAVNDGLMSDREMLEKWVSFSDSEKMNLLQKRMELGRPTKFLE